VSQLSFVPGDETWHKLREKGKANLGFFVEVILGYGKHIPYRKHAHDLLCRIAQGITGCPEIDQGPVIKLLLPRGWGKTSAITVGQTLHRLVLDPNCSILICNERAENAQAYLSEIKGHLANNELFRNLFPELIPKADEDWEQWAETKIKVRRETNRKEPSVFVIGVGGTVTGMHPDYIVVDDMISREAAENARRGSWQIMEEVNRWTHTLRDLLSNRPDDTSHRITFIGTRWYFDDCYDHLDKYFGEGQEVPREWLLTIPVEEGQKQTLKVTRTGSLVEFRRSKIEDGRASWPERWTMETMAIEQEADPIHFSANSLNEPASEATATFKPAWVKPYTWLDNQTLTYITPLAVKTALQLVQLDIVFIVDPGGFGKSTSSDRARAAIIVLGHTPTGEYMVLEGWSEKQTYVAAQNQIVSLAKRYRPRKVGIEVEGQQRPFFDQTRKMLLEAGINTVVEELKTEGKHKDDRILQLEPFFQRGLIYIGVGGAFTELRTQLAHFPRTARRDLLDALAYMPKLVRPRQQGTPTGQNRIQQELNTYYRKLGVPVSR
jgi:predicted phage terminase large subunit-like protein